jgi:hypothetical protein
MEAMSDDPVDSRLRVSDRPDGVQAHVFRYGIRQGKTEQPRRSHV